MDTIVLSHKSALTAILTTRHRYSRLPWEPISPAEQKRVLANSTPLLRSIDFEELESLGLTDSNCEQKLDVLVARSENRRISSRFTCHLISRGLPKESLFRISPKIYCVSPALAIAQRSCTKTLAETLMLLLELSGSYSLNHSMGSEDSEHSVHYHCEPAISSASLTTCSKWAKSSNYHIFREAASFTAEGSASPMESLVYTVLGLPIRYGGFGCARLPKGGMLLNHRIDFDQAARQMSGQMPYAICDCYIPSAKIDLEYNGLYHEQQNARIHDGNRNNGLKSMGIAVLVINKELVQNLDALEAVASLAYKNAGKRLRYQINGYRNLQRTLLNELQTAINTL